LEGRNPRGVCSFPKKPEIARQGGKTMSTTMKYTTAALVLGAMLGVPKADEKIEETVTHIDVQSSADGSSDVRQESTRECILSLPNPESLDAQVTSEAIYLRGINGVPDSNGWAKSYTAKLDVNYLIGDKELLMITTRSVLGKDPMVGNVSKTTRHTKSFTSDPTEGDTYAGRSHREYYFTKSENAVKDVRGRAQAWIKQQDAVLCKILTREDSLEFERQENAAFRIALNFNTIESYTNYLNHFPSGKNSKSAIVALRKMKAIEAKNEATRAKIKDSVRVVRAKTEDSARSVREGEEAERHKYDFERSICNTISEIRNAHEQMKNQDRIEKESGVKSPSERRAIGENLVYLEDKLKTQKNEFFQKKSKSFEEGVCYQLQ
jgi:hypothetical protein